MTETAPIHDAAALTRFIETRYHARHREQMPALAAMAERSKQRILATSTRRRACPIC